MTETIKRILITGPESTGKSKLTQELALHYKTVYNPEYAVEYIENNSNNYTEEDILLIAKEQLKRESKQLIKSDQFLFCDTGTLVPYIWSMDKFDRCHLWIEKQIEQHRYDLYLLCDIDIEWKYHPQREDEFRRKYLFDLYLNELKKRRFPFQLISDKGEKRTLNAIQLIDDFFYNKITMINTIGTIEQYNKVIEKEDVVLFYFSHEQCNVCKVLKPKVVEMLTDDFPKAKMYYCDTKKSPELAAQNRVFAAPSILIYFVGKESVRKSRNIGINELRETIVRPYHLLFE